MKRKEINPCVASDTAFNNFVEHLPRDFNLGGEVLYNARNVIKKFQLTLDNGSTMDVVVKRYRKPNAVQRLVYGMFRKGKAERAYRNSLELIRRGFSTPMGYAFLEIRHSGQLTDSFFVSGVDDAPAIREPLVIPEQFDRTMAADLAEFAWALHQQGILHHDFNSTNVLYHDRGDGHYTFSLIDINRMKIYEQGTIPPDWNCFENLVRFTWRLDLFEYVARHYAECRGLDVEPTVAEMIRIKVDHDNRRKRRKKILKNFKRKK